MVVVLLGLSSNMKDLGDRERESDMTVAVIALCCGSLQRKHSEALRQQHVLLLSGTKPHEGEGMNSQRTGPYIFLLRKLTLYSKCYVRSLSF